MAIQHPTVCYILLVKKPFVFFEPYYFCDLAMCDTMIVKVFEVFWSLLTYSCEAMTTHTENSLMKKSLTGRN